MAQVVANREWERKMWKVTPPFRIPGFIFGLLKANVRRKDCGHENKKLLIHPYGILGLTK